ncbi:MAG: hypothetical protein ACNS60_12040 [Candidatus Cyclobacteriaceae bacterium M2_1C_046]
MHRILFISILFILFLNFSQCKNDDIQLSELEKLPPKTITGNGTFGCLVNGKAWIVPTFNKTVAIYQQDALQIGGGIEEHNREEGIHIIIQPDVLEEKSYSLVDYPYNYCEFIQLSPTKCIYEGYQTISGELVLTKVDINNRIVSGDFEFTTVKNGCDTIIVTDGRFDLKLTL